MTAVENQNQPTNKFVSEVVEFNQQILGIEQRPVGLLSDAELDISVRCLTEEVNEFEDAHNNGDIIGAIDGAVDLLYFGIGVLYKLGLTDEDIGAVCSAVHSANMEKKKGVNERRGDGTAADAVKPEGWVGPEERIAGILDAIVKTR